MVDTQARAHARAPTYVHAQPCTHTCATHASTRMRIQASVAPWANNTQGVLEHLLAMRRITRCGCWCACTCGRTGPTESHSCRTRARARTHAHAPTYARAPAHTHMRSTCKHAHAHTRKRGATGKEHTNFATPGPRWNRWLQGGGAGQWQAHLAMRSRRHLLLAGWKPQLTNGGMLASC